ncbi:ribosome small subunit-dependent GTPase A [Nafulsella turpanensis]|uniref:ribosome small subunit-dependent GTPase A n=1 Tax=Nafulsella turpanensis TaxID=1265690 RepID=UPI00034A7965|nr:ribosome small subunit-dependent GTPase A [Nafulsella turpanensis]
MRGRIFKSTGSWYEVEDEQQQRWSCRLRGKFKIKGLKVTNPLAVGDWVVFEPEDEEGHVGTIIDIEPRENYIIRKSIKNKHQGHILAANIDQAVLIATLAMPRTSTGFIDRFLVTAESFRIPAVLVFNKKDLLKEEELQQLEDLRQIYEPLGYPCHILSAKEEEGIGQFLEVLEGKLSLLSGHSGVGKSTLLNAIAPEVGQKTGEVSAYANKGTHTTTFAEMFTINKDTWVIDTPGIKELGLIDMEEDPLDHYFPEMRSRMNECRFNNCTHIHEPGCAVVEALDNGNIAPSRYDNYVSMLVEEDSHR